MTVFYDQDVWEYIKQKFPDQGFRPYVAIANEGERGPCAFCGRTPIKPSSRVALIQQTPNKIIERLALCYPSCDAYLFQEALR